eukprot:c17065_g1_i1 orf=479-1456(-)
MNPLTQVKNTQKITAREAALGISEAGSWHAKYKDSAYVYAGNFAFDLTEGDLLAIFAQYGEIVDLNLVRDKGTGKSRGFAFLAYEDQRSTVLAVDNLNGANVVGRTIKVDHVANYKRKAEEDEEEEQRKREERGVCRAFQRGDCTRGSACKFSHDEKRSANTGWGSKDDAPRWTHDKYDRASQQVHRNRDEDGSRRDGGSRLKERQGTDISDGSRRDGGRRLQERERMEGRDEYKSERIGRERDHQYREADDKKDRSRHRSSDTQHRRGDTEELQKSSNSRKVDAVYDNNDEYYSGHSRKSHFEMEQRDSRKDRHDEKGSKHARR